MCLYDAFKITYSFFKLTQNTDFKVSSAIFEWNGYSNKILLTNLLKSKNYSESSIGVLFLIALHNFNHSFTLKSSYLTYLSFLSANKFF